MVKVKRVIGKLPGWQRRVIFFANIFALFYGNDEEMEALRQEVGTLETYGSRLVPILNLIFRGTDNLLILEHDPDPALINYFEKDLKLSLPEIKILSRQDYINLQSIDKSSNDTGTEILQFLREYSCEWVDGYVTDKLLESIASLIDKTTVSMAAGSLHGNNKFMLYKYIQSKGLLTFDTHIADSPEEIVNGLEELIKKGYRFAVIKAAIGASGIGMKKIDLRTEYEGLPHYMINDDPLLVQGWLDESFPNARYVGSPSVQMFLIDDEVNLYDITEQLLSKDSIHEGNMSPCPYLTNDKDTLEEILNQAEVAGQWLYQQGYRGTASGDFHIIERGGRNEVRLCEINARVTGATYPSLLARHFLPNGAWLMRNIRFDPPLKDITLMRALDENKILYRQGKEEGVLPFNFNCDHEKEIIKGQFLFIGNSADRVSHLLNKLEGIQSIHCSFDRD